MSCDRSCFDKEHSNFGYEDCRTCNGRDDGKIHPHPTPKLEDQIKGALSANDVAELLKEMRIFSFKGVYMEDIITFVAQQQAAIEALKAEVNQYKEWKESLSGWSKK